MLRAIVFDFDGVLVDSEPLHYQAFVMVGKSLGMSFSYEQYLHQYVGFDDRDAFAVMLAQAEREPGQGEVAALCERKRAVFEGLARQHTKANPGAVELVREAASAGLAIAIGSGATRADIALMLEALGLDRVFEVVVASDDVARSKPDPQTYADAVAGLQRRDPEAGISPGSTLAIEDTTAGLRSASDAGLMTLGLTTTTTADRLFAADRVIDSLAGVDLDTLRKWYG